MGTINDYYAAAKAAAFPADPIALQAKLDGVNEQFKRLGGELSQAEASGDTSRQKAIQAVLDENLNLRVLLVTTLGAAGVVVDDPLAVPADPIK